MMIIIDLFGDEDVSDDVEEADAASSERLKQEAYLEWLRRAPTPQVVPCAD